jgi:hypothetical protein
MLPPENDPQNDNPSASQRSPRQVVEDCLEILQGIGISPPKDITDTVDLPTLLKDCQNLLAKSQENSDRHISVIHHFACTGGTVLCKYIAAMPNVCLLSEIDPLSHMNVNIQAPKFNPSDILSHLKHSNRYLGNSSIIDIYKQTMLETRRQTNKLGLRLVIRDHAHSHYCYSPQDIKRTSHSTILKSIFKCHSVVTVRHPVESYISLMNNDWVHFSPKNFEEYCRRYHLFLDHHQDDDIFRYEDFLNDPVSVVQSICKSMKIDYDHRASNLFDAVELTGNSGRGGKFIKKLPAKIVPEELSREIQSSSQYHTLIERLDYQ